MNKMGEKKKEMKTNEQNKQKDYDFEAPERDECKCVPS